ncbi:transglutaminase-like domain-containing protein [Sphingomonas abietis]|uniref:Transglutaminase family protein n=1 Tax=Sphingomonas abietis TaxID=3012344 RepID=A0ABY7NQM0_9SPHN|nr:transglutaminase family protein [Sphingomonas abietis]WBO22852.1 transglutaminase family protein [Sphingomonas abietis]
MRLSIDATLDYNLPHSADLLMALEVAQMHDQILIEDLLRVSGVEPMTPIAADESLGRRTWTRGFGRVTARYTAIVDVDRPAGTLEGLAADDLQLLPALVVPYLFPSRYCEADKFAELVGQEFGGLQGGAKVHAIAEWIRGHLAYVPGTSDATTTATDVFISRQGVCRDFAHLMIAMTRAAEIPARMVAAYAWQLEPQDFHAVVEVWLDGGWHLVDPTGLASCDGIVRIGVGRDATDISFLTVFGIAELIAQSVSVERIDERP